MYRNGKRAYGDIVIAQGGDGIAVNASPAEGYDQQQDQFADIVVPHEEGIVVNDDYFPDVVVSHGAEGWDMQQDQFADDIEVRSVDLPVGHAPQTQLVRVSPVRGSTGLGDMPGASPSDISGGDDGLGFAAARRLKARIRGGGMKLGGPRVVQYNSSWRYGTGDTLYDPYGFGFRLRFPRIHIRLPKFIRKFQFGRFLGRTAIPFAAGGVAGLALRKAIPGLLSKIGGGGQPSESGAPETVVPSSGPGVPNVVMPSAPTPSVPSAPVATDSAGGALPPDILAALRGSVSPTGGREGATASEEVASAAEQAGGGQETGTTEEAGMFTAGAGAGGMGMVLIAGLGALALASAFGGKKRGRRRR